MQHQLIIASLRNDSDDRTIFSGLAQPPAPTQPRERPLHRPSDWQPHPTPLALGPPMISRPQPAFSRPTRREQSCGTCCRRTSASPCPSAGPPAGRTVPGPPPHRRPKAAVTSTASTTPCCPQRYGVSARRRSWRCRGPAARRRRSYRPTGCRRWRWCGDGTVSPSPGPCGGAGHGSCRGAVGPPLVVSIRQTVLLGGKSPGRYRHLASGPEDIEDGVKDVAHVGLAGPPAAWLGREVRLDQGPLGIGDSLG